MATLFWLKIAGRMILWKIESRQYVEFFSPFSLSRSYFQLFGYSVLFSNAGRVVVYDAKRQWWMIRQQKMTCRNKSGKSTFLKQQPNIFLVLLSRMISHIPFIVPIIIVHNCMTPSCGRKRKIRSFFMQRRKWVRCPVVVWKWHALTS